MREEAATLIFEGSEGLDGEELTSFIAETLRRYVSDGVTEGEFVLLCKLIATFLIAARRQ